MTSSTEFTPDDVHFMARALELAEKGLYSTDPNPRVGCVIVRDGNIVGEGWHEKAGGPHAEVIALERAGENAKGSTVYVTLEPCAHEGRTPPCVHSLVNAEVGRVVIAMLDPNPLVDSEGVAILEKAGITTDVGLLEAEAEQLNIGFITHMRERRPWVRAKVGASADGRTALANGESQWITSPQSRADVQRWRARSSAIVSGVGTVLADDPSLNVRLECVERQPLRVIVDSHLSTPPNARLFQSDGEVLIVTVSDDTDAEDALREAGAQVVRVKSEQGRVSLHDLMDYLVTRGVNEVFLETGATLHGAMLDAGLVDELLLYLAPTVLGDASRGMFKLPALDDLADKIELEWSDLRRIGPDIRLLAAVKKN